MTNSDTWKSWIDDLPLDGFDEGKDGLQDFITQLETERDDAMALFHAADNKLQELKAERDAALAGAVRVKPLEWEVTDWSAGSGVNGEDDIAWEAQTCLNSWGYGIEWLGGDKFEYDGARTAFKSLPEAKAAAQADYDARIRAALEPDPERLAVVRELQEACAMLFADYQTSTHHHPDHILIPRTAFDSLRAALEPDPERLAKVNSERDALMEALIWCSGSDDFQVGGKAHVGWEKLCAPLLKGGAA